VAAMVAQAASTSPIVISLPDGLWVSPTVRLGLRLEHENPSPEEIVVEKKPLGELLSRHQRPDSRGVLVGCEKSAENLAVLRELFPARDLRLSPGPRIPLTGPGVREMMFARL